MKDHFVKLAVTLIGKEKSKQLIRDICIENKIPKSKRLNFEQQIFSCNFMERKIVEEVEVIKEVTYG